jgi:hypothetical protein
VFIPIIVNKNLNVFIVVIHHYVIELGRIIQQISLYVGYYLFFIHGGNAIISNINILLLHLIDINRKRQVSGRKTLFMNENGFYVVKISVSFIDINKERIVIHVNNFTKLSHMDYYYSR